MNGVDQKAIGGCEAALGLDVKAVQPWIAEHLAGRLVSVEGHELVRRCFESRRLALVEHQLAAQGLTGVLIGGQRGARGEHQETQTEPH